MPLSANLDRVRALIRTRTFSAVLWTLASAMSGRIAVLLMSIVIARRLGPEGYGVFAFATSIVLLAVQFGGLGWPMLVTRMIPKYVQGRDWSRLRGLRSSADRVMLISTVLMAVAFTGFAFLFLDRGNPLFTGLLVAAALSIPTGFRLLHRQELAGINRAASGIFFDETMAPIFVLVGCLLLSVSGQNEIYIIYIAGTYCSAVVSRLLYRRWAHPEEFTALRKKEFRSWMMVSLPMITGIGTRVVLDRIDSIMLAPLSTVEEVGYYGSAFRIVAASNLAIMVNGVVRPLLSRFYEGAEHDRALALMKWYYFFTVSSSVAIGTVLVVFAEPLIRIALGPEFLPAAPVLQILAVGQVFGALSEASSSYLLMSAKEKVFGSLSVIGLAINVGLNFWLIPILGARGTAIAMAFTNILFFAVTTMIVVTTLRARLRTGNAS